MNVKEEQNAGNVKLCGWCGIPLGSANLIGESVCIRCNELLVNAGVSDEEIFGAEGKKDDSPLSHLNEKEDK